MTAKAVEFVEDCGCCGRTHPAIPDECRTWATCGICGDAHKHGCTGELIGPCEEDERCYLEETDEKD